MRSLERCSSCASMTIDPGQSAQIPMSDGRRSSPVKIEAQEREDVKTAAGAFKTIRYEAFLMNGVIYTRKGKTEIWLTDDARHLPVQIRLRMNFPVGSVTLQLQKERAFMREGVRNRKSEVRIVGLVLMAALTALAQAPPQAPASGAASAPSAAQAPRRAASRQGSQRAVPAIGAADGSRGHLGSRSSQCGGAADRNAKQACIQLQGSAAAAAPTTRC